MRKVMDEGADFWQYQEQLEQQEYEEYLLNKE
jgi:hypothetical protein